MSSASACPNRVDGIPELHWLSGETSAYLTHVCNGISIREIARDRGCHASTILRQIRRVEAARDDVLKDEALERLSRSYFTNDAPTQKSPTESPSMPALKKKDCDDLATIEREARRILRRLCESRSFLLVSPELEKAAVFRETVPGRRTRTAVVEREVAQGFALNDWIEGQAKGKVAIYTITTAGRAALKRLISEDKASRVSDAPKTDNVTPFQDQHREFGEREIMERNGSRTIRYNLAESPLTSLARKRDNSGRPYLTQRLLQAGERLREDFELAQMGPRVTQNWDNFLTSSIDGSHSAGARGPAEGPTAARNRVSEALGALGPGLADVAFRCCCFLEGLEAAEKRLGWSARSGKVVLRIALQRLADYYDALNDPRLIG